MDEEGGVIICFKLLFRNLLGVSEDTYANPQ